MQNTLTGVKIVTFKFFVAISKASSLVCENGASSSKHGLPCLAWNNVSESKWRPHDYETGHSECQRKWINGTDVGFWCWVDDQKHKADYCDCQQGSKKISIFYSGRFYPVNYRILNEK